MSDYAVKNLLEIDDLFEGDEIEARFSRKYIDSEELGVSLFRYAPNMTATDGHHHKEQEEAYVVVGGSGRIKLDDEVVELKQFDVVRVAPQVVRGFEAGTDGLEIIAVGGRKPEGATGSATPTAGPRSRRRPAAADRQDHGRGEGRCDALQH
jgi:quercetin dioxygenase-like cupin family protein